MINALMGTPWIIECETRLVDNVVTTVNKEYREQRYITDGWNAMLSAAPAASVSADDYRLAVRILYLTLERLSLAIEGCAKIGFEESSPTKNPQHFEVWNYLNDAQKAAKEKISDYHAAMKDNSK